MHGIYLNKNVTFYYPISEHQVQPLDHYETTATDLTEDQLNWFGDTLIRFAVTSVVNFINDALFEEMGSYFF